MRARTNQTGTHQARRRGARFPRSRRQRRPSPTVRRLRSGARGPACEPGTVISITQRDDILLLAPEQARRLAHALLRAASE